MSRDVMSHGAAAWITYQNPRGAVEFERKNPWEFPITLDDQLADVPDVEGLAIFRKIFSVHELKEAHVDATALGIFDLWCNGRRVGRAENGKTVYDELKPGWTEFQKRVLYFSYDLTPYLQEGENILIAMVAPGWYNGRINLNTYGETHISFLGAIHVTDKDGKRAIYTDKSWNAYWGGQIRASDIWDGELFDANEVSYTSLSFVKDAVVWDTPVEETYNIAVTPHIGPTVMVRPEMTRVPQSIQIYDGTVDNGSDYGKINVVRAYESASAFAVKKGEAAVIDLGQNMVGWPTFTVKGRRGAKVTVRVSEMLNDSGLASRSNFGPEGSIFLKNYRSAKSKIQYILRGDESGENYCPTFTFFGFRYCEVTADEDIEILDFKALVVGSATREVGHIETSHKDVNQLISNILWSQRSNYLSVPTDCPQRDERLGWTGDTQAFSCTAAYNADVLGFFRKWLQDARDAQNEEGMYPDVIPHVRVIDWGGAAWADAGIIVPYTMWKMYGDTQILAEHFDSMEKYMAWVATRGMDGPIPRYGDWLAYQGTHTHYISYAYYAQDAKYMASMCRALGKTDRAAYYQGLYERIRAHFRATCCDANGDLLPDHNSQTAYLLALKIGLLEEKNRPHAIECFKERVISNGNRLATGFVGTCLISEVLAEVGENDLAYTLLLQTEDPSWLYSVHQGATTIWECWNAYTKARGFGDGGMGSFNHYMYGSVQEWMYRHMAGIETTEDAPGFAHPILQPKPDTRKDIPEGQERITWVKASYESAHGLIESAWDITDGFTYKAAVPVDATLYLPVLTDKETFTVNGETHRFADYERTTDGKAIVMELSAGSYTFEQA